MRSISKLLIGMASLSLSLPLLAQSDVTSPSDPVVGTSWNFPQFGEAPWKATDNNVSTKYLCFDKENSGLYITLAGGPRRVTGIVLTSANDAPERDPASFALWGSSDGGLTYTLIASNAVPAFPGRFVPQTNTFANNVAYAKYLVRFPTLANSGSANAMQIAEVELLGASQAPVVLASTANIGGDTSGTILDNGNGSLTMTGYGADIWGNADSFFFAYNTTVGDFDVKVQVGSLYAPNSDWAKAGLMARETTAAGSRYVGIVKSRDNGINAQWRDATDGGSGGGGVGNIGFPLWLRLTRSGNVFTCYTSGDGSTWNNVYSFDTGGWGSGALPGSVEVGLALTSHSWGNPAVANFNGYATGSSPRTAASINIGGTGGYFYPTNGTGGAGYTITTTGGDIWGNSDQFVFVANQFGLCFDLAIRVDTYNGPNWWTKAGLMARESNNANSRYVNWFMTPGGGDNGYHMQIRNTTGGGAGGATDHYDSNGSPRPSGSFPNWLRLSRRGNILYAYRSRDGHAYNGNQIWTYWSKVDVSGWGAGPLTSNILAGMQLACNGGGTAEMKGGFYSENSRNDFYEIHYAKLGDHGGGVISDLTSDWKYGDGYWPDSVPGLATANDPSTSDDNWDNNNYGTAIWGVFQAWTTGNYVFRVANDDEARVFLSPNEQPQNLVQLFNAPCCAGQWHGNNSGNVFLNAGEKRYIRALMKEGGGGNVLTLGVQGPGDSGTSVIAANRFIKSAYWGGHIALSDGPVQVITQPTNMTVPAAAPIVNFAKCDGLTPWVMQWYKKRTNETEFVAIPGATDWALSGTSAQYPADDQAQIIFVVNGPQNSATSSVVTLTVTADLVPPALTKAYMGWNLTNVWLTFSEPMRAAEANTAANYNISGGLTVESATLQPNGTNVILVTSMQTPGTVYTLTITNLWDVGLPSNNPLTPDPTVTNLTAFPLVQTIAGQVQRDVYLGMGGTYVADMLAHPNWPWNPSYVDFINTVNNSANDENYGMRYAGHLLPSVSGYYNFWVHHDDGARFKLSTDENPANVVQIYLNEGCCPNSMVGPVWLDAGRAYYFEGYVKEGGGGDYLNIKWQVPGGAADQAIPSANLAYLYNAILIASPSDALNVPESSPVNFAANIQLNGAAAGIGKTATLWQQSKDGGSTWTTVAVNVGPSWTLPFATCTNNNDQFHFVMNVVGAGGVPLLSVTSAPALLTLQADVTPPALASIVGGPADTRLTVNFSEPMAPGPALNAANYTISDGVTVLQALQSAPNVVTLITTPQPPGTLNLTLSVSNLTDASCNANPLAGTNMAFTPWPAVFGSVKTEFFIDGSINDQMNSLLNFSGYINNTPNSTHYTNRFAHNADISDTGRNNYGARVSGWFIAPSNGLYRFYIRSDDNSRLFINTNLWDSTVPSGKVQLATENGCCNPLANISTPQIWMRGGQRYYMEALFTEGGGGDGVTVAVRGEGEVGPSDNNESIPASYFIQTKAPGGATLTVTPPPTTTNFTVVGTSVPLSLSAPATVSPSGLPISWTWQRFSGTAYTNIPGYQGNYPTFTGVLTPADSGAQFRVQVATVGAGEMHATTVVTIDPDVISPTLARVSAAYNLTNVALTFSEPVTPAQATDPANYSLDGGATILQVVQAPDGSNVVLVTTTLTQGRLYTLTVSNITDQASPPHALNPDPTMATFLAPYVVAGSVQRAVWTGLYGANNFGPLFSDSRYPNSPSVLDYISTLINSYSGDRAAIESYGMNYVGQIIAPISGAYQFQVYSDDSGRLRISSNEDAQNAVTIINAEGDCGGCGSPVSGVVNLVAGRTYYIEGLMQEGGGGDYLDIRWKLPGGSSYDVIPSANLAYIYQASIISQPTSISGDGGQPVVVGINMNLRGAAAGPGKTLYQWERSFDAGVSWNPIAGATSNPQTLVGACNEDGTLIRMIASVAGTSLTVTSAPITQSVLVAPGAPPVVVSAAGGITDYQLDVTFDEAVDPPTATASGNYSITDGIGVVGAQMKSSNVVTLFTTRQPAGTHTVEAVGVKDVGCNTIVTPSSASFTTWTMVRGALAVDVWTGRTGAGSGDLDALITASATLAPTARGTIQSFDFHTAMLPTPGLADYGVRVSGWFTPPSNGVYRFYIRSDDASKLFMNTTGANPAGKTLLAREDSCCHGYLDGTGGSVSPALTLSADTAYYIEAWMKQGGGQEYLQVTFRADGAAEPPAPGSANYVGFPNNIYPGAEVAAGAHFGLYLNPEATGSTISFVYTPPANTNASTGQWRTLGALATANNNNYVLYKWEASDGSGGWTNVAPAENFLSSYDMVGNMTNYLARYYFTTPVRLIATAIPGGASVTNETTVTVPDVLNVVSVGSIDGTAVLVIYDKPVDPTSAAEPSNYAFDGSLGVLGTPALTADGRGVLLIPEATLSESFVVNVGYGGNPIYDAKFAAAVVADVQGRVLNPSFNGNIGSGPGSVDPVLLGAVTSYGSNSVDITAGGSDIFNTSDGFYFFAWERYGDFDIRVRMPVLTNRTIGTANAWSKGGLMARPSLSSGSRMISIVSGAPALTGGWPATGSGQFAFLYRDAIGGGAVDVGGGTPWASSDGPWMRLVRRGAVIEAYTSLNGLTWTLYSSRDTAANGGAYPHQLMIGLATTSHNNVTNPVTGLIEAQYRNLYVPTPPTASVDPVAAEVPVHGNVTFTATILNEPANSGLTWYQWTKNGAILPGETNLTLNLTNLQVADSGTIAFVIGNDGGGLPVNATLTVTNGLPAVTNDLVVALNNMVTNYPVATLLSNDADPEGDPLSVLFAYGSIVTVATNFDEGMPANSALYDAATVLTNGGIGDSGCLQLTPAEASKMGSWVLGDLTPGHAVVAFRASFKAAMGQGSGNPADGFSFCFGNLPAGTWGEEGPDTFDGLTISFDNYDNGGNEAPAIDVKWQNATVGHVNVPKTTVSSFFDIFIELSANGKLTLTVDGTPVYSGLQTPYTPIGGRFGFGGRTGGEYEVHRVDDLSITAWTTQTPLGGDARLVGSDVQYTPPTTACTGNDAFYYVASDGQTGGTNVGMVTVQLQIGTPLAVVVCPPAQNIDLGTNCVIQMPDLTSLLVVTDSCPAIVITQNPAPGTPLVLGATTVTFVVTDGGGQSNGCQTTVTLSANNPAPAGDAFVTSMNTAMLIPKEKLLLNDTHPDGRPFSVTAASAVSTNGGSVLNTNAEYLTYIPVLDSANADAFTYTVTDCFGITANATVLVTVRPQPTGFNKVSLVRVDASTINLHYRGIPNRWYIIERATTLDPSDWTPIATVQASPTGAILYTDGSAPSGNAFYRTRPQ